MSLKEIMGTAYREDLTLPEVEAFFEGNSKIVNLASGGYVDKGKFEDINSKYQDLFKSTKDYEDIKTKYQALVEKQTKDEELALINKYAKPEYAEFIHFNLKRDNKLNEDGVKEYLKSNSQFGIVKDKKAPVKVINTYNENGVVSDKGNNPNSTLNNAIRTILGRSSE